MLANTHPDISQLPSTAVPFGKGQSLDDTNLWLNVKKDNELAFSILYKKYTQRLYNYGMHYCHDRDLVMDCLQELFASIWTKRKNLSTVHSVSAYLFKAFRRLLMKKLTWRKRFMLSLEPKHELCFDIVLPTEQLIENEETSVRRQQNIVRCIKNLSKRQREAIFLKFYNNLNYSDIASIMDLQVDSVYNIISKAIESLRQQLKSSISMLITVFLSQL
jgi:RNA polymerase sigma factor (sigma-70 family)